MFHPLFALDRGAFFGLLAAGLVGLALTYCLVMVARAFWVVFTDIRDARELDQLAAEFAEKRRQTAVEDQARLNNGCDHVYEDQAGALPPNVCNRCGLAKKKPAGACDHVWRVLPGIVPQSQCEHCGKTYCTVHEPTSG